MASGNVGDGHARRSDYRQKVADFVDAYARDDDDRIGRLFPEICDDPTFDVVLAETISDIPHATFDPVEFRHGVLSMCSISSAPYISSSGNAHAIVQLFFIPFSGALDDIHEAVRNTDKLTEIASSFLDSGLAATHSSILACGSLLDPLSAAAITPGTVRLALRMISPVLTGRIEADNLGEALASVFGVATDKEPSSQQNGRAFGHRLLPVARIVTPPDGIHVDDALTSYKIDDNGDDQHLINDWKRLMGRTLPETVMIGEPCSIMRGCAVMAINMIEHAFSQRAMRTGHSAMPEFDEVSILQTEASVHVAARHGTYVYGPVQLPAALFFSDLELVANFIDGLSNDVRWRDDLEPKPAVVKPH
ncbi:hypothetical protein OIU34_21745 [Pararhizobium sp. BT-229]|uniref:hypothetical protein n=1 Tax=Pararhizobium sp. BT-229 TaxID=2986923 RepID=UPI0021F75F08|nr:hypothetical protein [Pararhizobium sp. BT-229]MCV9964517.1 hypothetical protein [Pararhizobium sp. BT-229]